MESKLQKVRIAAGLTQEKLSEKSGVSLSTIRKLESGERDILKARIDIILFLTKVLDVSVEELLGDLARTRGLII